MKLLSVCPRSFGYGRSSTGDAFHKADWWLLPQTVADRQTKNCLEIRSDDAPLPCLRAEMLRRSEQPPLQRFLR